MARFPVMIDCDTGIDDAAALILAHASGKLDIRGITTVAGNVELPKTTLNTLKVLDLLGVDIPVYMGAEKPLCCALETAAEVHGVDGLKGIVLPETTRKPQPVAAWDAIYSEAVRQNGKLQLIAVGPLTNLAIAFGKYPQLPALLERIVVMGGSMIYGNTTPCAEFNIMVDPEAAEVVLHSGVPVYLCGLDVTHCTTLCGAELDAIHGMGGRVREFFADVCRYSLAWSLKYYNQDGAHLHDPCAVMFALDDSYFTYKKCWVGVETAGSITRGKTVTDVYSDKKLEPNAYFVTGIDRDEFARRVMEYLKSM